MPLFLVLFVVGCILNGLSFETAGMALLGTFVAPPIVLTVLGLFGYITGLRSSKRGPQ